MRKISSEDLQPFCVVCMALGPLFDARRGAKPNLAAGLVDMCRLGMTCALLQKPQPVPVACVMAFGHWLLRPANVPCQLPMALFLRLDSSSEPSMEPRQIAETTNPTLAVVNYPRVSSCFAPPCLFQV